MRLNLQTKLLSAVALVVGLTLATLAFLIVAREKEAFQHSFKARGLTLAQALETGIGSREDLKDAQKLQSSIYKLMWLDPEITEILISVATPEGLRITASNNTGVIGTSPGPENEAAFAQGTSQTRTISRPETLPTLSVITPIHVGGQQLGTYDIKLSLEAEETTLKKRQAQLLYYFITAIILMALSLSLIIKVVVITPIRKIQEASEKIRAGYLDWRTAVKSKDEFGELAKAFNGMAEKLQKSQTELENTVASRTKELHQRVRELERLTKLLVGRELKMAELKKEIARLKERGGKEG